MYHTYKWSTYDSMATGNPVYQWLQLSGKKINLLITGEASGATNPITPHYVTSSAWYDLFNPQQQDVINALKDCTGLWGGTSPNGGASASGGTVTVTDSVNCCVYPVGTASQTSLIQDQDLVWVNTSSSNCGTGSAGAHVSVTSATTFTYSASSCSNGTLSTPMYISAAQSWAVPYEYPYKNALKAYWAAVVAHYGPNFKIPAGTGMNYYSQLNYFRFGGSVGSEWYPYCTSGGASGGLENLPAPYTYTRDSTTCPMGDTCTPWLGYYQEMGNYLQSLAPPFQIIHSINAAETPPDYTYGNAEAGYAVGWSNRFGIRDGFGSQGLSVQDEINCTGSNNCDNSPPGTLYSASNWHPMFKQYNTYEVPLELQPIALSYPGDTTCSHGCSVSTFSGDLPTFLSTFATSVGATDVEIYWRDLSLSYDVNYYCALNPGPIPPANTECVAGTSATTGGQLTTGEQFTFFQLVGQGNKPADCGSNMPQSGATGTCAYATNIGQAHGQH